MSEKMILVNSQWQGGAVIGVMHGAQEIENLYLNGIPHTTAEVSASEDEMVVEHDMIGYRVIRRQMETVMSQIKQQNPQKMFTLGGSCDADVPSIAYMNELLRGEMTLLWMDAHGDLNLPSESLTKLFYGMPVRALMGGCNEFYPGLIKRDMRPEQLINLGGRDFDAGELAFIASHPVQMLSVKNVTTRPESILDAVHKAGDKPLYVHLDLDCLDPIDFPDTAVPIPNGLPTAHLLPILHLLKENCQIAAFSLQENLPVGHETQLLKQIVEFGLSI